MQLHTRASPSEWTRSDRNCVSGQCSVPFPALLWHILNPHWNLIWNINDLLFNSENLTWIFSTKTWTSKDKECRIRFYKQETIPSVEVQEERSPWSGPSWAVIEVEQVSCSYRLCGENYLLSIKDVNKCSLNEYIHKKSHYVSWLSTHDTHY